MNTLFKLLNPKEIVALEGLAHSFDESEVNMCLMVYLGLRAIAGSVAEVTLSQVPALREREDMMSVLIALEHARLLSFSTGNAPCMLYLDLAKAPEVKREGKLYRFKPKATQQ